MRKKIDSEKPKQEFDHKTKNFCVWEIYLKSNKVIYHIRPESKQASFVRYITFDGFKDKPTLFLNSDGWGFTASKKGFYLLSSLKKHLGESQKLNLIITNDNKKKIKKSPLFNTVIIPFNDVKKLLLRLGQINEQNNNDIKEEVASFLSTKFPKTLKISSNDFDEYKGGEISSVLDKKDVIKKLNEGDLQALNKLFPKIFEYKSSKRGVTSQKGILIQKTKKITDRIYLDVVIEEFEKKLRKDKVSEEEWQKFLKEKVFKFLSNYVTTIDKENISVDVAYPDFVSVDVYGFVDIFEIKMHTTPILTYDNSHENYYWKGCISEAISQIENYIDAIIHNSDDYIKKIKRKLKLDIKVVRPRGYILVGSSKQFKSEKELEDFRKLSVALKNIDFILYDQVLESLKNLRTKL